MSAPDTALGLQRIDPDIEDYRDAYLEINHNAEKTTELVLADRERLAVLETSQSGQQAALSVLPASGTQPVTVGGTRLANAGDARYAAFPGATVLADGRVFMIWREGTDHVAAKDGIFRAQTSADQGRSWSTAFTVLSLPGVDLRDPSVSMSADKSTMYLLYFKGSATGVAEGVFLRQSTDQGATFGPEVRIDPNQPYAAGASPVVPLANGLLLCTWYGKDASADARESVYVATSPDGGTTWGNQVKLIDGVAAGLDMQEPWAAVNGDTVVIMYRHGTSANIGVVVSTNGGATWGAPFLAFPGTGRPSVVFTAESKTLVCTYRAPTGGTGQHGLVRYSRDFGATWSQAYLLERAAPNWWTYSAPVEIARGQILVPTTVEESATVSKLSLRYITEGGGVSPFGDIPPVGASRVLDRFRTVAVADDFDRPNSASLGYSSNGQLWVSQGGAVIQDGALFDPTADQLNGRLHYANALTPDVEVEAEGMWTGNAGIFLVFRLQNSTNYIRAGIETAGTRARIYKTVGGVITQIGADGVVSVPAGFYHRLRVTAVGDNIRFFVEDQLVTSGTDAALNTMPWVGLRTGGNVAGAQHRFRNFVAHRRTGIAS